MNCFELFIRTEGYYKMDPREKARTKFHFHRPGVDAFNTAKIGQGKNQKPQVTHVLLIVHSSNRDCLTRWIWRLMTCMVSSRPKKMTRRVFKFLRCSNVFITEKVFFSRLMRVYVGLIMLVACNWSMFPLVRQSL